MKIVSVSQKEGASKKNIFIPVFQKEPLAGGEFFSYLPEKTKKALNEFAKKEFTGEDGEIKSLWLAENGRRIVLFGLGEKSKWNERKNQLWPRRIVRYAKKEKIENFAASLLIGPEKDEEEPARVFSANAVMADFEYTRYKSAPEGGWPKIKTIFTCAGTTAAPIKAGILEGVIIGEEVNYCRALANTPGGDMTPRHLAEEARVAGRRAGFRVHVLDEKAIRKLKMGGVLGVAKGSDEKPRFIILEYFHGPKKQKPLVLVGKGVTFDTGGLNLKPESAIYEMHMDMSGGAAVIHGISAIARLKLPVNVIGLIPAVENMPSGSSYRPGDVLKTMSGKTIEVLNTDAEGRVILSDALFYGAKKYKPGLMVNFATLTGAAHVALGNYASALFTNRENLQKPLTEIGTNSGDYVWPLPLWDEYLPEIRGTFGDIANASRGDRWGGAIHGAKFLEQFVEETPWAHIDIAPKMTTLESEFLAKGASGVGVRYIVELAETYTKLI
ncbi:MAG: leucyl aminopeptidase [Candidatus Sungbacteria bacterium]|nr:leucyl aminopeptidase [Candidatus Sungbacteria bacterium]